MSNMRMPHGFRRMTNTRFKFAVTSVAVVFAVSFCLFIFNRCSSLYSTASPRWNLSAIYNPASSNFHPSYRVYHNSDDRSLLLIKLFPNELLFNQANAQGEFRSQVSIQLQNYLITEDKPLLVDSITYTYTIKQENVGRRFLTQIPFKAELGNRYQLRVVARDVLRKDFNLRFIDIDKRTQYSQQNFNILNPQGIPYFNNVLETGSVYRLEHRNNTFDTLYIDYYINNTPLPNPTFATQSDEFIYSKPDSTYIIKYSPETLLALNYTGMYQFRVDTAIHEGLTIVNFGADFPKINTPAELIDPLTYLTTSADYKQLQQEENKKLGVDNFWLGLTGSTGRARELIRIYYNRVYFSNYYFSTNKPGWKTDRGMVYIVYGPPQNLQKSPLSETWIYYMKGASSVINFTFQYEPTPFSLDNFVLKRSESQEWHWREAVESWRKGHIFLQD
jgi:GWxTD domain-containing protein